MTQALRLSRADLLRFPAEARCIAYVRVSTKRLATIGARYDVFLNSFGRAERASVSPV